MGFQRDVLGADPRSAWMLDAFGHDPGFPGLMASAGSTSSSWARGPFHQWGPYDNTRMQFPAEFEWLSPDGSGLLTAYMANHYGAGWQRIWAAVTRRRASAISAPCFVVRASILLSCPSGAASVMLALSRL